RLDMPIKMRRKANRNALLAKLMDNEVRVIDNLSLKAPKTKDVRQMLEAMGVDRTCLIAVQADNANVRLGARNIEHVTVCPADALTCFNMLNHRYVVISKSDLEAWISGPSAQTGKSAKAGKAGA
ncbi:MAG: 50S ribosomal protein L4, partial [Phycisphaerales bacterium]|nr:50S ribosomal protein L4 [Phycisphaerales bacterium]